MRQEVVEHDVDLETLWLVQLDEAEEAEHGFGRAKSRTQVDFKSGARSVAMTCESDAAYVAVICQLSKYTIMFPIIGEQVLVHSHCKVLR